ncbi:putative solute carrier family 2 facilitated glucose transporter member 5-like isoform 2 [Scophthalmus maximus]|uniref:Putative solute carrier family 2 facilitated glucose transporter member 5-like isoform 2 n=1 Tax=Scophthalmus maximus TaxID=52904 RepID=A0A2U9CEZ7_SCOMX|nr:putative solute carrier family 2 facilitated glucose transporter member 5-like isoform 2 [Scophthalmus maximus]
MSQYLALLLDCPVVIAAIFICGIGGTFQYGYSVSVMTSPSVFIKELVNKTCQQRYGVSLEQWQVSLIWSFTVSIFCIGGLVGALVSGQLLSKYGSEFLGTEERWPWLLGFNGFTALLQLATLPFLPESPSFLLLHRGDREACDKALKRLWGNKDYTMEVEEMMKEKTAMQSVRSHSVMELIRNQTVRWQLITIIITFTGLQLCGINAVYFYSFDVFRAAGIQEGQLRYVALGTGLCEVSTSVACFMIIESTGKKDLLFRGYMAMSATLVLLTITLYLQNQVPWMSYCSMALIFLFIIFFASGPAGIIAPLPGEILTQSFKSAGYTVACTLNWTGLFGLGMLFPVLVENMGYFCFLIFLIFCSGCGLYVRFNVPETKNKTVLEIAAEFERMHSKSGESKKKSTELNLNGIKTYETKF